MAEESEEMLVEDRISAARRIEEDGLKVPIKEKHRNRTGKDGKGEEKHEGGDEDGSDEERHHMERHSSGTHVEDGNDEVDCTED